MDSLLLPHHRRGHHLDGLLVRTQIKNCFRLLCGWPRGVGWLERLGYLWRIPFGSLIHGHRRDGDEERIRCALVSGLLYVRLSLSALVYRRAAPKIWRLYDS